MPLNIVNADQSFANAIALHTAGNYAAAEQAYKQVLMFQPNHPGATQNLGVLAFQVGRNEIAVPLLRRALELMPNNAALHCNLADALAAIRLGDEAISHYEKSIAIDPNLSTVYNNLGIVYSRLGRVQDAVRVWEKAIELADRPTTGARVIVGVSGGGDLMNGREGKILASAAYNNLGNAHLQQLELQKAVECHRKACELNPQYANARSNLLRDMTHLHDISPEQFLAEHRRWWELHGNVPRLSHANTPDPDRKLRIGWISSDFREHSVTHFLLSIFENFDREQFEFICYSGVQRPDIFTKRLAACTVLWRNALTSKDEDLAKMIRDDAIDVLFDLSGHTSDHRLRVMAFRPAPVQATYLGYPMTTGSPVIDWRIGDPLADPPGLTDSHYAEKLHRLPHTMWCYQPPVVVPCEEVPPVVRNPEHPFTFGSFNNCSKISPVTFRLWSEVLRRAPGTRLVVKASAMADQTTRERVVRGFTEQGIAAERITAAPQQIALAEHFAYYRNIDLALDTFPYNGTTTTCEALWMNVPVVSLAGKMHISRVGASLLTNVGLASLVADDEERFVEIASTLAKDVAALTALRRGLRGRLQASPLMDGKTFAREFGEAIRTMWRQWCATR
jgi:predicted O-linked N-acetylglucosamine transferase (SPINDLY family)